MTQASAAKGTIDIGIITIKEEEMRAVLVRLPSNHEIVTGQRDYNIFEFKAETGSVYRLAVLRCIEQGNGEAHEATRDLIEDLAPRWILVVGIAGGAPSEDFTLGDVIVSDRIHDLSVEAVLSEGEREYSIGGGSLSRAAASMVANLPALTRKLKGWNDPSSIGLAGPTLKSSDISLYGDSAWQEKVRRAVNPLVDAPGRQPQVRIGAIASSDRLVKDADLLQVWRKVARNILAIEMESAGVYRAARERVPMIAIRGISDIVGLKRSTEWTNYACQTAAAFMQALLRGGCIPLLPRTKDSSTDEAETNKKDGTQVSQPATPPPRGTSGGKLSQRLNPRAFHVCSFKHRSPRRYGHIPFPAGTPHFP